MINNTPEKQIIKTQVGDVEILLPQLTNIPVAIRQQPTALWRAEPELDNGGNQKLKPNGKPRISKAPRNERGLRIISQFKPIADTCSQSNNIFQCSPKLYAQYIRAGIDTKTGRVKQFLRSMGC